MDGHSRAGSRSPDEESGLYPHSTETPLQSFKAQDMSQVAAQNMSRICPMAVITVDATSLLEGRGVGW